MIISFHFLQKKKKKLRDISSVTLTGDTFENYYKQFGFIHDDFHQKVFN